MAVKITEQMYDTFTNNGYTEDDIKNTVNHYREQGMPDSAIFTNLNKKHRELAGIKDVSTPQIGDQPNYDAILNDPSLTPQQQAEQIKQKGETYRAGLDKDLASQKAKMYTGAAIKIGSPLVGLGLAPFTAGMSLPASMATLGAAEGATYGLGEALQNQNKGIDFAKEVATQGLLGGAFGAGTGALFRGASRVLPKVFNRPINTPKDLQELSELATNPQQYVSKTARPIGLSRLPKENIQEVAPTVTRTPTGETQLNVGLQAVEQQQAPQPQGNVPEMVQPEIPTTTKQTKLSESVQQAKGLPTDIKKTIKQNAPTYESMTNNDLIIAASDAIDKDLMGNIADVMAKDKFNAFDVERTRQIAKRLNAQNTPEANETLINLLDKASEQASKSGQAVQAFSLWNNLTPEGAILKTQKLIKQYNERFGKNLKLTQDQINTITTLQEKAQALPDGYDKDVALAQSLKYQQSLIPKYLGTKLKAYRNISLLLNPKTLGRNVVGNALFNTLDTASKTLAVPVDKVMSAFTKTHTRALPQVGESLKGLKLGAERGFKEAMQGINTADVSSRYDLQGGKVFESKIGQAFETALDLGLRVPDRAFYNSVYAESLANQLKASGLKEPTQKMLDTAEQEALEGVFQNKSKLSDVALGLRQQFNRVGTKEFGLGDLLIPYAQTPANLAQQGINYSPLGLLKAGASLKGGNQRQASLDIARALVGTGIGAAGYNAVKAGQATGTMETGKGYQQDLRLKKNLELLGIRPQQVGDMSYSQFQPASIPFAVGAATATGESPVQAGINTLLDLPFLQNYNKIMSDIKDKGLTEAGANFAASIPSQFVPTALSQVNQSFDNTARETYSPNKLQQGLNVAGAKIPFVAQTLPERVNVKGEPVQRYESTGITRLGDIFLNPTFINKKKNDVVIKEMNKLYNDTGEIAPLLPVVQRTIKVNGEQKKLTGKEVNQYQKEVGKISYYLRKKALESDTFKSMNSDEKIDYLSKMNKGVTQAVKIMMFKDNPKKIQPFAQEIIDNYDTFTK